MAIPQKRYIDIFSSVVNGQAVSNRELIGRVLTTNPNAPYNVSDKTLIEFGDLESVGTFFGTTSEEYAFASLYFGFVSKDNRAPKKISFMRYNMGASGLNATISSANGYTASLSALQQVSGASMSISVNGAEAKTIENISLSSQQSLTSIASALQTAIGGVFSGWTVEYQAVPQKFIITTTLQESVSVQIKDVSGNLAELLGWLNPIVSNGAEAVQPTWADELSRIFDLSNNCGTFTVLDWESLESEDITAISAWNASENVKYMFICPVDDANYATTYTALGETGLGTWLMYSTNNTYPQFAPMAIGATLNYQKANTNANFNYYPITGMNVQVSTDALYQQLVANRTNFYGATQQAGELIAFLQPGVLCGSITDAGVYYNEMWLKDDIFTRMLNAFISVKRIAANSDGALQIRGIITNSVQQALLNGTILIGKTLSDSQILQITELTGDDDAWRQVENNGYYLTVGVEMVMENGIERFKASYTLCYAKGDSIVKVEGYDVLY